jgi:hypothetical protein
VEQRYYRRNIERERTKHRERRQAAQLANHKRMLSHLSQCACADCGVTNPIVLEFHHGLGVQDKQFEVSRMVTQGYTWPRIEREIAKCIVLCANCHRIRTATERGHYRARGRVRE